MFRPLPGSPAFAPSPAMFPWIVSSVASDASGQVDGVAVIAVDGNRHFRMIFDGGVDDGSEVADVGIFPCALVRVS